MAAPFVRGSGVSPVFPLLSDTRNTCASLSSESLRDLSASKEYSRGAGGSGPPDGVWGVPKLPLFLFHVQVYINITTSLYHET